MDFDLPRTSKAKSSASITAVYDDKNDTITLKISKVSESFQKSATTPTNQVINYNVQLKSRLKIGGNVVYIGA